MGLLKKIKVGSKVCSQTVFCPFPRYQQIVLVHVHVHIGLCPCVLREIESLFEQCHQLPEKRNISDPEQIWTLNCRTSALS